MDAHGIRTETRLGEALGNLQACLLDDARANSGANLAQRITSETQSLLSWAEQRGCCVDFDTWIQSTAALEIIGEGNEHRVWLQAGVQPIRVLKITQPPSYGVHGSAISYVENLLRCNQGFGDDIRVEGVTLTDQGPAILTSQPFIQGDCASETCIHLYFTALGYEYQGHNLWQHPQTGVRIADARPANILIDQSGECFPIDVHVLDAFPH